METIPISISFSLPVPSLEAVILYWLFGVYFLIIGTLLSGVQGCRMMQRFKFSSALFGFGYVAFVWPYFFALLLKNKFLSR